MLQRGHLTLCALCLALISGCRTPMNVVSRPRALPDSQLVSVSPASEAPEIVPAVDQSSIEGDETASTAERLWNRIRPSRRISLPRTDFWQDDGDSAVLEPVDDFDTGF